MTDSSMDDFKIEKVLGKGSFGSVYLVRRKEDNKIYALKSVTLGKLNPKEQRNSVNEVRILASVNHPNVIGYKEAFWDDKDETLNIVMEYADDGDLQTKICKMRKEGGMFKEELIWSYSIQMIEGLKALHDKKIMHRDLKSANIFLVKDKHQCKIGDMNVSKVIKEKELLTQTGTPYYASPEVWRDEPYSYKSDLWSIGCVIYELCALRPPFKGKDLDELFLNVCKGKVDRISHIYSDDLWKMILMLLQVDVKNRCDCDKFLNSRLISRKIQEMKNENKDYRNLEKNKEISEGHLLDTIRFDNILDIKNQLPTKKNYSNTNSIVNSSKGNKKVIKKKGININVNNNEEKNRNKIINNNAVDHTNPIKYQKINNKQRKILYNNKNMNTTGKSRGSIKKEIDKDKIKNKEKEKEKDKEEKEEKEEKENKGEKEEKKENENKNEKEMDKNKQNELDKIYLDLESDSKFKKTPPTIQPEESENLITNLEKNINSSLKNSITKKNKYIKNSPDSKAMIYQKPKLYENSVKRDKNILMMNNNNKPMTTKRTAKKINYMARNITPRKGINKVNNKTEQISAMNDKQMYSMRNKNIYKSSYASINREKTQNYISRPIETSPTSNYNTNINSSNNDIYSNVLKKKNYSKKVQNQRPDSAAPLKKYAKINTEYNIFDKNISEINLDISNLEKRNNNSNIKKEISNRENMVNMLINNYNKNNINFNSYNPNNNYNNKRANNSNYIERPMSTTNNPNKNYMKRLTLNESDYELNNAKKIPIKYQYNKMQLRDKQNINKKRMIEKNMIEREMTEPELLKMANQIRINDSKKDYQRTLNISLTNQEKNAFLHQQRANKMLRYNTNNNPRYNQYYTNNVNQTNPQIFNNYVSINNVVTPSYPVKVINVFGQ